MAIIHRLAFARASADTMAGPSRALLAALAALLLLSPPALAQSSVKIAVRKLDQA